MMGMLLTVLAVTVIAAALTPALIHECRRVEQERRYREWLASNPPELQQITRAFEQAAEQIGRAMLPALTQMAQTFAEMARVIQNDRPAKGDQ